MRKTTPIHEFFHAFVFPHFIEVSPSSRNLGSRLTWSEIPFFWTRHHRSGEARMNDFPRSGHLDHGYQHLQIFSAEVVFPGSDLFHPPFRRASAVVCISQSAWSGESGRR